MAAVPSGSDDEPQGQKEVTAEQQATDSSAPSESAPKQAENLTVETPSPDNATSKAEEQQSQNDTAPAPEQVADQSGTPAQPEPPSPQGSVAEPDPANDTNATSENLSPLPADTPATPPENATQSQDNATQPAAPESAPSQDNATVAAPEEKPIEVTAVVEPTPEPVSGVTLPSLVPGETSKSRNPPPTPQVDKTDEGVSAQFGMAMEPGKAPQEKPSAQFGVTAPETAKKTEQAKAEEPAPKAEKAAAKEEPKKEAAKEEKPKASPKDMGLNLGAETPEKKPEPEKKAEVKPKEPVKPKEQTAKKPQPKLQQAPKKAEPVVIGDVEVHPLDPAKPINPMVDGAIESFKKFADYWVNKVSSSYIHGPGNIEVVNEGGKFIARYTDIDRKSVKLWIKEKPYKHTPFVGLMRYQEYSYEAVGDTPDEALGGKFDIVRRLRITEIFRYSGTNWIE